MNKRVLGDQVKKSLRNHLCNKLWGKKKSDNTVTWGHSHWRQALKEIGQKTVRILFFF